MQRAEGTWHSIPIEQLSAWCKGDAAERAVARGDPEIEDGAFDLAYVDAASRRRLTPVARAMLHCAGRLRRQADGARVVFASRYGEATRALALLRDIAAGNEVSPTAFSHSVHNASAGMFSMACGTRAPVVAVAAGEETFALGLVEAMASHLEEPGRRVLYVFGDDALPSPFDDFGEPGEALHAIALLIGQDCARTLRMRRVVAAGAPTARPLSVTFVASLAAATADGAWQGARTGWRWQWLARTGKRDAH